MFQHIGANRPVNDNTRFRGLSESSNLSCGSMGSSDAFHVPLQTKFSGRPNRQPLAPPEDKVMQQHAGFARFLKQHASPPHNRVTAGGRIVPAGPLSPPPMFDYASLAGVVRDQPARPGVLKFNEGPIGSGVRGPEDPGVAIGGQPPTLNVLPMTSQSNEMIQGHLASADIGHTSRLTSSHMLQVSPPLLPMGVFEDGSMMAYFNGAYYRTYWDGSRNIVEPIQITTSQPLPQPPVDSNLQVAPNASRTISGSSKRQNPIRSDLFAGEATRSRLSSAQSQQSSFSNDIDTEQIELKKILNDLDKYLALHHYDLGQEKRASLVIQRKALVEQLDAIRRTKEGLKPNTTTSGLVKNVARSSNGDRVPSLSSSQVSRRNIRAKPTLLYVTSTGKSRKALSPAAPPFVPGLKTSNGPSDAFAPTITNPSDRKLNQATDVSVFECPVGTSENPAQLPAPKRMSGENFRDHGEEQSLDENSSDPAMRIIHPSDIEYAQAYLYDRTTEEKRYCTSISEFQEAVRRVRAQARLYGCTGGSSKDPAYDAEQDIWWAICDHDPIPLPSKIPDHVSRPRPWDWSDSAFNCHRANVATPRIADVGLSSMNTYQPSRSLISDRAVRDEAHRAADTTRPCHHTHGQALSPPFGGHWNGNESNKMPPNNTRNITHSKGKDLSSSLDEQEYKAVQHAIEVLNRRSQSIIAQKKETRALQFSDSSTGTHATREPRFQLALQNFRRSQESSRSDPEESFATANFSDFGQNATPANLNRTSANTCHHQSLQHPFAEKKLQRKSITIDENQKNTPESSTSQSAQPIPKRRSSARRSNSNRPSRSEQHSSSETYQGKKKPPTIFEEASTDNTASVATLGTTPRPSRDSVGPNVPEKRKRQLSPRKAAKKAKALFQKGRSKPSQ